MKICCLVVVVSTLSSILSSLLTYFVFIDTNFRIGNEEALIAFARAGPTSPNSFSPTGFSKQHEFGFRSVFALNLNSCNIRSELPALPAPGLTQMTVRFMTAANMIVACGRTLNESHASNSQFDSLQPVMEELLDYYEDDLSFPRDIRSSAPALDNELDNSHVEYIKDAPEEKVPFVNPIDYNSGADDGQSADSPRMISKCFRFKYGATAWMHTDLSEISGLEEESTSRYKARGTGDGDEFLRVPCSFLEPVTHSHFHDLHVSSQHKL